MKIKTANKRDFEIRISKRNDNGEYYDEYVTITGDEIEQVVAEKVTAEVVRKHLDRWENGPSFWVIVDGDGKLWVSVNYEHVSHTVALTGIPGVVVAKGGTSVYDKPPHGAVCVQYLRKPCGKNSRVVTCGDPT